MTPERLRTPRYEWLLSATLPRPSFGNCDRQFLDVQHCIHESLYRPLVDVDHNNLNVSLFPYFILSDFGFNCSMITDILLLTLIKDYKREHYYFY
jgi:hypothetical protein